MMPSVFFRCDGNHSVGLGHVMRCLSIADSFATRGYSVTFILADENVRDLVVNRGYDTVVLDSAFDDLESEIHLWDTVVFDEEPVGFEVSYEKPEDSLSMVSFFFVVDSYYVTERYFRELMKWVHGRGGRLIYIDDVAAFPYPCDVLINYNAHADKMIYDRLYESVSVVDECEELQGDIDRERIKALYKDGKFPEYILGPIYAPIRTMFRGLPKRIQRDRVKDVLISTGGSDELHIALSMIRKLLSAGEESIGFRIDDALPESDFLDGGVKFHFLLGGMNADVKEIYELLDEPRDDKIIVGDATGGADESVCCDAPNIILHRDVSDMSELISSCDIVVSAAGSTLYEIAACGVPMIVFATADNQILGTRSFEKLGLAVDLGDIRVAGSSEPGKVISGELDDSAVSKILSAIDALSMDYDRRVEMGERMQKMIDGCGADRLVEKVTNLFSNKYMVS